MRSKSICYFQLYTYSLLHTLITILSTIQIGCTCDNCKIVGCFYPHLDFHLTQQHTDKVAWIWYVVLASSIHTYIRWPIWTKHENKTRNTKTKPTTLKQNAQQKNKTHNTKTKPTTQKQNSQHKNKTHNSKTKLTTQKQNLQHKNKTHNTKTNLPTQKGTYFV